jgi:polysaccharide export outer membrane protein
MPLIRLLGLMLLLTGASIANAQNAELAERYQLGSGDVISISVFGQEDLSFERIRLSDAATVPYPFLGEVRAKGRTPTELEDLITNGLKNGYLVNPRVTVNVLEYRQFYVNGAVSSPGGYSFQPGITVRKAIALAGGRTDRASNTKMFVNRDSDPEGEQRRVSIDDRLQPGDILTIEESFF